jgi:hypothetical protein
MARYPNLDWAAVDEVILGCANQAGEDNRNVARKAALLSGPADVGTGGHGQSPVRFRPGSHRPRRAGHRMRRRRVDPGRRRRKHVARALGVMAKAGAAFDREQKIEDSTLGWRFVNPRMQSRYGVDSMTQTADNLAREHGIDRGSQDAYARRSQQRVAQAQRRRLDGPRKSLPSTPCRENKIDGERRRNIRDRRHAGAIGCAENLCWAPTSAITAAQVPPA